MQRVPIYTVIRANTAPAVGAFKIPCANLLGRFLPVMRRPTRFGVALHTNHSTALSAPDLLTKPDPKDLLRSTESPDMKTSSYFDKAILHDQVSAIDEYYEKKADQLFEHSKDLSLIHISEPTRPL